MTSAVETTPPAAAAVPKPKEIDALVFEFEAAQKEAAAARAIASVAGSRESEIKGRLIAMVESFGFRHTEKSKRLQGLRTIATTTVRSSFVVDQAKVGEFKTYLDSSQDPELIDRFFSKNISYSLVDSPTEVLKKLSLGARAMKKISEMLGLCTRITMSAPSLKIDTVKPDNTAK